MPVMNFKIIATVLSVFFIVLISGCKATAVRNVEEAQFVVPAHASLSAIKQAIVRGSKRAGWRTKTSAAGVLFASYSYKRNRFGAVVKIKYDRDSYEIIYHSSHNLKYKENVASESEMPEFFSESKDFFSENNPFKKNNEFPASTEKPATIHKIYNKWVIELERRINAELALLSRKKQFVKASITPVRKQSSRCEDTPVYNASGQGRIARSSVNIRTGAGTHCNIVTTVSNRDVFTLLGKKNNWFYIALNSGGNGWIYAPLVSRPEEKTPRVTAKKSAVQAPPIAPMPPAVPAKSISIAVIRFKTLNKEARDLSLGELVSETFTSALVNSRHFKIIEREQLDKLVKEMEMGQTGFIETTDAVEIGKMLHADAIVTGSVALLGGQVQLNARIIEIESAYVISADTKTNNYTLKNINKMVNEIVAKLARKLGNK